MREGHNYNKLLASVLAILMLLLVLIFLSWNKISSTGRFNLIMLLIIFRYVFLVAALILVGLRLLRGLISNGSLIYVVVCALNLAIGFFSSLFYFFHQANIWWLNQTMLNLLFGFLMLLDMFVFVKDKQIS